MAPLRQEYYYEDEIMLEEKKREQEKQLKIKKRRKLKRKRKVILGVMTFAVAFFIVYRYVVISNMNMENIKLKKELANINNSNVQLQLAAEKSVDLKEVERYAENELGLQKPQSYQIEYINLEKKDLINNKNINENKNQVWQVICNIIEFFN